MALLSLDFWLGFHDPPVNKTSIYKTWRTGYFRERNPLMVSNRVWTLLSLVLSLSVFWPQRGQLFLLSNLLSEEEVLDFSSSCSALILIQWPLWINLIVSKMITSFCLRIIKFSTYQEHDSIFSDDWSPCPVCLTYRHPCVHLQAAQRQSWVSISPWCSRKSPAHSGPGKGSDLTYPQFTRVPIGPSLEERVNSDVRGLEM